MVSGNYVNKFNEASHVVFDGNLDDPTFRCLAIQKLEQVNDKTIVTDHSKSAINKIDYFNIEKKGSTERVRLIYKSFLFGRITTFGYPFKDNNSEIISSEASNTPEKSQPQQSESSE